MKSRERNPKRGTRKEEEAPAELRAAPGEERAGDRQGQWTSRAQPTGPAVGGSGVGATPLGVHVDTPTSPPAGHRPGSKAPTVGLPTGHSQGQNSRGSSRSTLGIGHCTLMKAQSLRQPGNGPRLHRLTTGLPGRPSLDAGTSGSPGGRPVSQAHRLGPQPQAGHNQGWPHQALGQPGGPADVSAGPSSPPSHPRPGVPRSLFPRQPRVHLGRVSPNLLHQHHREAHPESQVPPWRFKGQPQSQEGTSVTLRQAGVATSWTTGQGPRTRVFKGAPASGSGSRRTVPPLSSA